MSDGIKKELETLLDKFGEKIAPEARAALADTSWERRALHAEQENHDLHAKVRDLERRLTPYEVPGALCGWCGRPTVFVGGVPAAHPRCYERFVKAAERERELLSIIEAYRGDGVL